MNDDFEQRIQRHSLRQIPSHWRGDILCAARKAAPADQPTVCMESRSFWSSLREQIAMILWPSPRAWAGLAAVWVLIVVANIAARDDSTVMATRRISPPSPQMQEMLKQREQLLAELMEEQPAADRPKAVRPRPQSWWREDFLNA